MGAPAPRVRPTPMTKITNGPDFILVPPNFSTQHSRAREPGQAVAFSGASSLMCESRAVSFFTLSFRTQSSFDRREESLFFVFFFPFSRGVQPLSRRIPPAPRLPGRHRLNKLLPLLVQSWRHLWLEIRTSEQRK